MARIPVDPNYNSPTFPRATAAADLFLKEDVQALAAAMSTHVHDGTGKGLVITALPAGAIADGAIPGVKISPGTITTTQIGDGSISTVDLADGSVTTAKLAPLAATNSAGYFSTNSSSTTSTTPVALAADASATLTTTGGPVLIWAQVPFSINALSAVAGVFIQRDAGSWNRVSAQNEDVNGAAAMAGGWLLDLSVPAGSHTYRLGVSTSSATLSLNAAALTQLLVLELRR